MSSQINTHESGIEARALSILGSAPGISSSALASACGVSESYISQLRSRPEFKTKLADIQAAQISRVAEIDRTYDRLESKLQIQLEKIVPVLYKPHDVIRALQAVNMAKRRSPGTDQPITETAPTLTLHLPTVIHQTFTKNITNQVIMAGNQDLTTLPTNSLQKLVLEHTNVKHEDSGAGPS